MKSILAWLQSLHCFLACPVVRGVFAAEPGFHIGIATLTVSQAEDNYRGAERMTKESTSGRQGRDDQTRHHAG